MMKIVFSIEIVDRKWNWSTNMVLILYKSVLRVRNFRRKKIAWSILHVVNLLDFMYIILNTYVFGTLTVPLCNKVNRVFMVCRETSGRTRNGSSISSKISFRNGVVVLSIEQCELIFPLKHCMVKSEWRWLHWILEIYRFFLVA